MPRKAKRKIKDLVEMLEDPDNTGYIGGDYEDMMDLMEEEELDELEDHEEIE
ncbi:MAG: hypothetical protein WD000_08245 [Thermodesulfobacteriota bacterium]|jgi:hypothetical protein